jgi:hypothetical protein
MKKIVFLVLLCVAFAYAHAETIILRTGARMVGTILVQNDDVVIIRNTEGARFQYPRADVQEILAEDVPEIVEEEEEPEQEVITSKRVSALLEISGGAAINPNDAAGGGVGVDLIIGSHHIGSRHILIGGGLGYHGLFFKGEKLHFLPIQAALRMPFIEATHAPVFGIALGYGIAMSKNYTGGLYAGIDFGYRYQINAKSALAVVVFAQFQQAKVNVVETVEGVEFINKTGRNFVTPGVKLALYF